MPRAKEIVRVPFWTRVPKVRESCRRNNGFKTLYPSRYAPVQAAQYCNYANAQLAPLHIESQPPAYLRLTHLPACSPPVADHLTYTRLLQFHTSQGTGPPCLRCYNYTTSQKTTNGLRTNPDYKRRQ